MPREGQQDLGHEALVGELRKLLDEAERYEFHDFKNSTYPAPKVELERRLRLMAMGVVDGKYDN
jgi:hypothetical protein